VFGPEVKLITWMPKRQGRMSSTHPLVGCHRRRAAFSQLSGLANADASSLVPSATDAQAARGRGIELALWQNVLGSACGEFGVRIGTGQKIRRKNATASE